MGGTISLLGDGENALLNEILYCQTCAIVSSSSRSHTEHPQQVWYLPNKLALPFGFGTNFADPNAVCSQSLSDVTQILNGARLCFRRLGLAPNIADPNAAFSLPWTFLFTDARGGQKLRLPRDEESRCIEIGRETTASLAFVSSWVCRLMSRRRYVHVTRPYSGLHQSKNHSVTRVTRNRIFISLKMTSLQVK